MFLPADLEESRHTWKEISLPSITLKLLFGDENEKAEQTAAGLCTRMYISLIQ